MKSKGELLNLSTDFLKVVRANSDFKRLESEISLISKFDLNQLDSDKSKKVFWLNLYNAFSIVLKSRFKPNLSSRIERKKYFSRKSISIFNQQISLDFIEHTILRKSAFWWSYGYLSNPFKSDLVKGLELKVKDFRIHFALNCGGRSCPPIKFYNDKELDDQLDFAMEGFIKVNSKYDEIKIELIVNPIFLWFQGDFNGKKGITSLHQKYDIIPFNQKTKLVYDEYIW